MVTDWKHKFQTYFARAQVLERLPLVLVVVLMAVLAHRLALLTWSIVPNAELNEVVPPEPAVPTQQTAKPATDTSVSQWSLFGKVEIVPVAKAQQAEVVPETRLNLTLLGVLASSSKETAKAIISDPSGNEEYYSVGKPVPGGATVDEIHETYVVLKRNGRQEILRLPQEESITGINAPGAVSAPQSMSASTSRMASTEPMSMGSDGRSTGAILRDYREALNRDPQSVMDAVRAEPVREGDRLVGYRISPGRDRQLLNRFGLRPGDVVTTVNGIKLDNPIKGLEIIQNLQNSGQMSLEVMRNGVAQTFSFNAE